VIFINNTEPDIPALQSLTEEDVRQRRSKTGEST
jgi:hypothetical protein